MTDNDKKPPFYVYDIFERLKADKDFFAECLHEQFKQHHSVLRIDVESSFRRLFDAHEFWVQDIRRIEKFEDLDDGAEELKLAAHLAYWIRRTSPIIIMDAPPTEFKNIETSREYHHKYANEFSSLTIGFDLCAFFMANKVGSGIYKEEYKLDESYVLTMCHFMKCKNVSPHALFLIFKSLFFDPLASIRS